MAATLTAHILELFVYETLCSFASLSPKSFACGNAAYSIEISPGLIVFGPSRRRRRRHRLHLRSRCRRQHHRLGIKLLRLPLLGKAHETRDGQPTLYSNFERTTLHLLRRTNDRLCFRKFT